MRLVSLALFFFPRLNFGRRALPALSARVGQEQAARIWAAALRLQPALARSRPSHSFGTDAVIRYMEWDLALYRAALAHGMPAAEATALIEEIGWNVFGPSLTAAFGASRLRSADRLRRVRWVIDLLFAVVFTRPFRRVKHERAGEVAFDVVACPLAAYFRDQGAPELTAPAACRLDDRMAAAWGVDFRRAETLAGGRARCDFRFIPK